MKLLKEILSKMKLDEDTIISNNEAISLADYSDTDNLMNVACTLRDSHHRNVITYSKKVFIPLTQLCRNVCHYCTFATAPRNLKSLYMSIDEAVAIAKEGAKLGCKEALITMGEKPELRYKQAKDALLAMGFSTTLEYVNKVALEVFTQTGLLPHLNVGCMNESEMTQLRNVAPSMGLMLESSSLRLCEKGMPHYGSPDKNPIERLKTIELAGQLNIPFTTGLLIGIGETRIELIESLLEIRQLHLRYGHIQEIIIQNFRAKENTKMALAPEPDLAELQWTIAVTRIIFGAKMSIQVPPNLSRGMLSELLTSGINDWGGVSPITPDHVNPEAPWPHLTQLSSQTSNSGKLLQERLTVYPKYVLDHKKWVDQRFEPNVLRSIDTQGLARTEDWAAGEEAPLPQQDIDLIHTIPKRPISKKLSNILDKCNSNITLNEKEIVFLFESRGEDFHYICQAANKLREEISGNVVSYVVNCNINYTNICYFKCKFCAFAKGKVSKEIKEKPYNMDIGDVVKKAVEAWQQGASEVCLQGGIHPKYTGQHYIDICTAIKLRVPDIHIHAFSPLEIWQGAKTLNISTKDLLKKLKSAGLKSLPGTAAEILDDKIRANLCPDKINTKEWLAVMKSAHDLDIPSTATIMFGHIDNYSSWAKHLQDILTLQKNTQGFTEFVPLPFVSSNSPIFKKGKSRKGPTAREAILMHAVSRLYFSHHIPNIQASWIKLGSNGISTCLKVGANDVGGTLMHESITRAAGAKHGQMLDSIEMEAVIEQAQRIPQQRNTFYQPIIPMQLAKNHG